MSARTEWGHGKHGGIERQGKPRRLAMRAERDNEVRSTGLDTASSSSVAGQVGRPHLLPIV